MVETGQIVDTDLPEPVRHPLSDEEKRRRQNRVLQAGLYFAIGYSLVHKLFVPFFLSFTALHGTVYAKIDTWALHSLLLAFFLFRPGTGAVLSALAGMSLSYGAYEIVEAISGKLVGWLVISRLISSIPIALCCAFLLGSTVFPVRGKYAWLGALSTLAALALLERSLHGF